jgi:DNA ligase (NAD+)
LRHEIDGLVVKVHSLDIQEQLGIKDGRPRGQIAWKFPSQVAEGIIQDIQWQVGRTGKITPVATLSSLDGDTGVEIGGVEIRRASLHTVVSMNELGLKHLSSTVLVSRRNDVIPYVEAVLMDNEKGKPIHVPGQCPVCGAATELGPKLLYCWNPNCSAKLVGDIEKWIKVFKIEGCGSSFLDAVITHLNVHSVADLYDLTTTSLMSLDGYQIKKAQKILHNIKACREVELDKFIAALNIPNVGRSTAKKMIENGLDTIDKMMSATISDLDFLGTAASNWVEDGLRKRAITIQDILDKVQIKHKKQGVLTGKTFCFTGKLPSGMSRGVAQQLVELHGGSNHPRVVKGLDFLVQANKDSNTTKTQKARKYGTVIIDEDDFHEMIDFSPMQLAQLSSK